MQTSTDDAREIVVKNCLADFCTGTGKRPSDLHCPACVLRPAFMCETTETSSRCNKTQQASQVADNETESVIG